MMDRFVYVIAVTTEDIGLLSVSCFTNLKKLLDVIMELYVLKYNFKGLGYYQVYRWFKEESEYSFVASFKDGVGRDDKKRRIFIYKTAWIGNVPRDGKSCIMAFEGRNQKNGVLSERSIARFIGVYSSLGRSVSELSELYKGENHTYFDYSYCYKQIRNKGSVEVLFYFSDKRYVERSLRLIPLVLNEPDLKERDMG